MSKNKINDQIIAKVATENKLDKALVKEVVKFQFEYLKNQIESGELNSIRLPYMGIFSPNLKQLHIKQIMKGLTDDQKQEFLTALRNNQYFEYNDRK